jgi:hypothetical protein
MEEKNKIKQIKIEKIREGSRRRRRLQCYDTLF